jgi:hypothetical protein
MTPAPNTDPLDEPIGPPEILGGMPALLPNSTSLEWLGLGVTRAARSVPGIRKLETTDARGGQVGSIPRCAGQRIARIRTRRRRLWDSGNLFACQSSHTGRHGFRLVDDFTVRLSTTLLGFHAISTLYRTHKIIAKDATWTPAHAVRPSLDIAFVFVKHKDRSTLDHGRLFPIRQPPRYARNDATLCRFKEDQGVMRVFAITPERRFHCSCRGERLVLGWFDGDLRQRSAVRRSDGVPLHVDVLDTDLLRMGIGVGLYELLSNGLF